MFIDGQTLPRGETLTTDVCIVGAGAAGLALAQELDGSSISVLLLDSGGFQDDAAIQSLADGTSEVEPYPFLDSRARCFGGTTTRWSGACIPLDAGDFHRRDWLPHSGWPFDRAYLWPYYQRAQHVFGLPKEIPVPPDASPFHQSPLGTKVVQLSNPLDLGRKYRQQIERSPSVTLVTHANVTQLIPDADGQRVVQIDIQNPSGQTFTVRPKTVILATGGIENARLLLASNTIFPQGLGNDHDVVGRFFMEHFYHVVGILPLNGRRREMLFFTNFSPLEQTCQQGTLGLTDELRSHQQLLNMHLRFYRYSPLEDTPAVIAAKQFQNAVLRDRDTKEAWLQWQRMWSQNPAVLPHYVAWHVWNKITPAAAFDQVRLQAWIEQEPDPNNRVTLSQRRDRLGQPQAHLTLRCSERMQTSVERSLHSIAKVLHDRGFGDLQYGTERIKHLAPYNKIGFHHMGTTRMHESPRQGVVDADCKVHTLHNLYVAGSSVFPTGGAANPTLTIVALALRLADHIRNLYAPA